MKARIAFVFLCMLGIQAIAQLPPYIRNPFTTNTPPGITNTVFEITRFNPSILIPPITNGLICYVHPASGYVPSGGSNRVSRWNDVSGFNNHLTNSSVATSPWWLDNGVQFDQSVKPLYLPSTVTASTTNFSVFAIVESEIAAGLASDSEAIWTANSLTAALIYEADVSTRKGRLSAFLAGGIRESTLGVHMSRHLAGMVCNMNQTIFVQGSRSVEISNVGSGTVTGGLMGSFNNARGWKGRIFGFLFYNRALLDYEIIQIQKWANGAYFCKELDANIVIDADSISSTYGSSNSWPQILSARSGWRIVNKARVGHLLSNMITDAGTRIDLDAWDDGIATNRQIAIVEGGSNDIKIDGQGTNQIYTNLVYWCQLRSARGYRTIVTTILPREQSAPFETTRQALNALIRSNWTGFADGMLDIGGSTIIGDANDEANAVYYQTDKIHLAGRGAAVVAEIARPVIEEVLKAEKPSPGYALKVPQWVDAQLNYAYSANGPSAPALTVTTNSGPIQVLAFDNGDILYGNLQLPHNIAVTNASFPKWYFNPHIHWSTIGTLDSTHSNVTWRIEWEIANINGLWNVRGTNSVTKGSTNNFTHYVTSLGPITNDPPPSISAIFRCRIMRPASVAQDYSNAHDVLFDGLDLHIPVGNKTILGSREEFTQ